MTRRHMVFSIGMIVALVFGLLAVNAKTILGEPGTRPSNSTTTLVAKLPAKLLLHQIAPPTAADVVRAARELDELPFDGIVVASEASSSVMRSVPLNDALTAQELAVLSPGMFHHLTDNFLLVYATPAGQFTDFLGTVADNFANFARHARAAGFVGLFFDVEEYFGPAWSPEVACRELSDRICRANARNAGAAVMRALIAAWPDIKLLVTYGPSISDPRTSQALNPPTINDVSASHPLYGSFAVGLAQATVGTRAVFIDGGEVYTQNSQADVQRTVKWLTTGMAENSPLIPSELKALYPTLISPSMGIFDFPEAYRGKGPGTPEMWQNDIAVTLAGVRDYAWAYSERFNWTQASRDKVRQPPPTVWVAATARGRQLGQQR